MNEPAPQSAADAQAADPTRYIAAVEIERPDILFCMAPGETPGEFWSGSSDGSLHRIRPDSPDATPLAAPGHDSYVTGLARSKSSLVSGGYDRRLIWRDAETLETRRDLRAHDRWIRAVEASPDGRWIASAGDDMVCRLWTAQTGELRHELRGHETRTPHHFPSMLFTCAFTPDSRHVATGDKTGRIVIWDAQTGKAERTLDAPEMYTWDPRQRLHSIGGIRSLEFSPNGELLAVGGMGHVDNIDGLGGQARVSLFDWRKGERAAELEGGELKGLVEDLAFHPEGAWLLAAGGNNKGFLWFIDPAGGKTLREESAPMHIHETLLQPDLGQLCAVGHERAVCWRLEEAAH